MFGCFSYGTRVTLADGTQEKIGKIVNQSCRSRCCPTTRARRVVPKRSMNWFDNGITERSCSSPWQGRQRAIAVRGDRNHLISTPGGWREAGELAVGDRVLQAVPHHLSDFQWQVVLGGLMGDGALSPTPERPGARFRFGHGAKQAEYGDWKASLFANIGVSRSTNAKGAVFHDLQPLAELAELRDAVYVDGKKVLSDDYLKRLTPLSLAIWYMDDGGFTLRSKGLQHAPTVAAAESEICVEAMSPDLAIGCVATWPTRGVSSAKLIARAGVDGRS